LPRLENNKGKEENGAVEQHNFHRGGERGVDVIYREKTLPFKENNGRGKIISLPFSGRGFPHRKRKESGVERRVDSRYGIAVRGRGGVELVNYWKLQSPREANMGYEQMDRTGKRRKGILRKASTSSAFQTRKTIGQSTHRNLVKASKERKSLRRHDVDLPWLRRETIGSSREEK